jgi:hypothetical protein
MASGEAKFQSGSGEKEYNAAWGTDAGPHDEIDETEFEDLAAFRLKPEAIDGESQEFLDRYAAYLRRNGFNFD